jgi:hypothetical protein
VLLKVGGSKQRLVPGGCSCQAPMQPLHPPCSFPAVPCKLWHGNLELSPF